MAFLVVAYPELSTHDYNMIQKWRRSYDKLYFDIVEPHFTLIFPTIKLTFEEIIKNVTSVCESFHKFEFNLRASCVVKSPIDDYTDVYLVPDEGNSQFIKLHDKLYQNELKSELKLEVPFIPHIEVANSKLSEECKTIAEDINANPFFMNGHINNLTILKYEDRKVENLIEVNLKNV